jgi:hypothetical protein
VIIITRFLYEVTPEKTQNQFYISKIVAMGNPYITKEEKQYHLVKVSLHKRVLLTTNEGDTAYTGKAIDLDHL